MASTRAQDLLQEVQKNITDISQDPSVAVETRKFEEAELILPKTLREDDRLSLIQSLAILLAELQQDPTPAVNLLLRLLENYSFNDVLRLGTESLPFVKGLAIGGHMVSFNRLILGILEKATKQAADAALVAGMLDTMLALVRLWLCTDDSGVAIQASRIVTNLLKVDREIQVDPDAHLPHGGQGLVWKRIFGDRDIYGTFFEACSLAGSSTLPRSKNQVTVSQARLMEWLPGVGAMDWNTISRSHHPDVEQQYGVQGGLIQFAAISMVDYEDDILMYRCLVKFYEELLIYIKPSPSLGQSPPPVSSALPLLIAEGLHARTAAIYLQLPGTRVDSMESTFLYGPSADYIAAYANSHPEHFMASQMCAQVNERLRRALSLSPVRWAHAESPKHDLLLVASLPRQALLTSFDGSGDWNQSPLSLLPSKQTNSDVLAALAGVFHGPEAQEVTFPPHPTMEFEDPYAKLEASAARTLYYHYNAHNQHFWQDITTHADTVALTDLALASINCLIAVITANWSAQPDLTLPSNIATPDEPYVAIVSPPALEYTMPYLLSPPRTFANLVGGRGDAESAAYKVASAKFDALKALHNKLSAHAENSSETGYRDIVNALAKCLARGPLSREGDVGGRVGTLEL